MKSYQTDERLILEGKKVKILCSERATKSDSGVVVDYFRCTVARGELFAANIPSKGELIVDGLQLDSEIVADLAIHFAKLLGFKAGESRPGRDYYSQLYYSQRQRT